jgi:U3 small nucleolar RNA-associated protein 14
MSSDKWGKEEIEELIKKREELINEAYNNDDIDTMYRHYKVLELLIKVL